ncbi:hypothetical protein N657DRAFT_306724 [Parathielavia appendiculata]|uniref:Uncharacterized protein n=1 Tax=Parathielavia appendiculata TaxID=2587402 RepID=A0AAN6Z6U2_9PEZI|nr:hypothetical protein N657DRAFT_306724 [Parathielavia appendiculata]
MYLMLQILRIIFSRIQSDTPEMEQKGGSWRFECYRYCDKVSTAKVSTFPFTTTKSPKFQDRPKLGLCSRRLQSIYFAESVSSGHLCGVGSRDKSGTSNCKLRLSKKAMARTQQCRTSDELDTTGLSAGKTWKCARCKAERCGISPWNFDIRLTRRPPRVQGQSVHEKG